MAESSSNRVSKTFTNRGYRPVSSKQIKENNYELYQYDNSQSLNSFSDDVSSAQRQSIKQIKNRPSQNERPLSRQRQFLPNISIEGSNISDTTTSSTTMENPNEATNIQKIQPNTQSEYASQAPKRHRNRNTNKSTKDKVSEDQTKNKSKENSIKELTSEHLGTLKATFDKISSEYFLSKSEYDEHLNIYHHLRDIILKKRSDAQIILYGSLLFDCCLKETNSIDIDIQFKETSFYQTLKESLEIIRSSIYCKEAHINVDREPLSIDLSIINSNTIVRLTSNNNRAIHISEIIQIYTKFDERVLPLMRIFRILAKICNIDRPDLGTLHPIVFHLMLIYFLQQLDPPVLPCLHEYVYGIDQSPIALNDDQYNEFLQTCRQYIDKWKSKNVTTIEMLFLQFLSYYVEKFNSTRFIICIQTRMPLLKYQKENLNRKLFCLDPTSLTRNLCYTIRANCSYKYFQRILTNALNYFCQEKQEEISSEMHNENDEISLVKQRVNGISKSYQLFLQCFPKQIGHFKSLKQTDIIEYYKQTFDNIDHLLPKPILQFNQKNTSVLLQQNDDHDKFQQTSQRDFETLVNTIDDDDDNELEENLIVNEQEFVSSQNQIDSFDKEQTFDNQSYQENFEETPFLFEILSKDLDENQKTNLYKEYKQQVKLFNDKMQQILNNIKSLSSNCSSTDETVNNQSSPDVLKESIVLTTSTESNFSLNNVEQTMVTVTNDSLSSSVNPSIHIYDITAKNFGAEQGAPSVCIVCYKSDHIKSNCPELSLPNIVVLPPINKQWFSIISRICRQVRDQCKLTKDDLKIREEILGYLQYEFAKCYPSCEVYAYGSSHNGFGFRQSDLDISVILNDESNQSNLIVLEKFFEIVNSNSHIFTDVVFVREARVPIIRSIHSLFNIEVDISLHNVLAMENTRLLKCYTDIDSRVSELGYMIKHLIKTCDIGDAKVGALSSYAYILMIIHFLQQIEPAVVPVLQQLNNDLSKTNNMIRHCDQWNVYFFDDLSKLKKVWINKSGPNLLTTGELWIEFLRYYTEKFDYEHNVVTIRQLEPLKRDEKGWFRPVIAIEDPFILTHNLADKLSIQKWTLIRRVFIRARQRFASETREIDIFQTKLSHIQQFLFDINILCPENATKFYQSDQSASITNKRSQHFKSKVIKSKNEPNVERIDPLMYTRMDLNMYVIDQWIPQQTQLMYTNTRKTFSKHNRRNNRTTDQ